MKSGSVKRALVLGGILMLVGVLAFIDVFVDLSPWVWVILFAAAGVGALAVYLTDRSDWSLLIPAYVMLAIALLIALAESQILRGEAVAVFVLIVIALPFLVVFLRNRSQWWALIPAYVLAAVALMIGLQEIGILSDAVTAPYVLAAIAIPFFVVFARNRRQWWFLIPAGVLTIVALSLLIAEDVGGYVGPVILVVVGIVIVARLLTRGRRQDTGESAKGE